MTGDVVVYLKDGRAIDVSDRSPAEVVRELMAQGVGTDDIECTVHKVGRPEGKR